MLVAIGADHGARTIGFGERCSISVQPAAGRRRGAHARSCDRAGAMLVRWRICLRRRGALKASAACRRRQAGTAATGRGCRSRSILLCFLLATQQPSFHRAAGGLLRRKPRSSHQTWQVRRLLKALRSGLHSFSYALASRKEENLVATEIAPAVRFEIDKRAYS